MEAFYFWGVKFIVGWVEKEIVKFILGTEGVLFNKDQHQSIVDGCKL